VKKCDKDIADAPIDIITRDLHPIDACHLLQEKVKAPGL
jgi:hypothetical protein